jgi:hypothetical protein
MHAFACRSISHRFCTNTPSIFLLVSTDLYPISSRELDLHPLVNKKKTHSFFTRLPIVDVHIDRGGEEAQNKHTRSVAWVEEYIAYLFVQLQLYMLFSAALLMSFSSLWKSSRTTSCSWQIALLVLLVLRVVQRRAFVWPVGREQEWRLTCKSYSSRKHWFIER